MRIDQLTAQNFRFELTSLVLLYTQAWPRIYPHAPSLSQAFGA